MGSSQTTEAQPGATEISPPSSEQLLESGTLIGERYLVERLIARGGMSTVYLATHIQLKRRVALKVLTPDPFGTGNIKDFQDRFRVEAETLASLDHPNIVTIYDYGETDSGHFYLAMEYVAGPRCTELLRAGPMGVRRAINLVLQVCSALHYAHEHGLVHRDIKPSNILLREDGDRVKVVDFGLVQLQDADNALSNMGFILGSPHFMAPEQAHGLDVDARADIYAVGVLLFTSLTGCYPFHGPDAAATLAAHINEPIPSLREVNPDLEVPPLLEQVVHGCLAKLPEQRYPTMASVMTDLAMTLAQGLDVPPPPPLELEPVDDTLRSPVLPPPPLWGGRPWLLPALGVGLGGLVLLIFWGARELLAPAPIAQAAVEPAVEISPSPTAQAPAEPEPSEAPESWEEISEEEILPPQPAPAPVKKAPASAAPRARTPKAPSAPAAPPPPASDPAPPPAEGAGDPEIRDPWAE